MILTACGGGGGGGGTASSAVSSQVSSAVSSAISSDANSSNSSASSSEDIPEPVTTPPNLVDANAQSFIQDQLVSLSLNNIGGQALTECSSDLPDTFTVAVSADASTCEISGEATALLALTNFTVTADNAEGSDSALIPIEIVAASPFITTWKTDNEGASDDDQITITTSPDFSYDYTIEWGDGNSDENVTGDITHTYATPGEYQISITGHFPQTYFNLFEEITDANKLLSVDAWGNRVWLSMEFAFAGATNLVINDNQAPDLSRVTSMLGTFASAVNFTSDISHWDVSNVTDMTGTFFSLENFNGDLSSWNVSNVTTMEFMFNQAFTFNSDISQWDVSNVTNMAGMFSDAIAFNQDISSWDVAKVTDFSSMFEDAEAFDQNLGGWNISNATSMSDFAESSGLTLQNYDAILLGWSLLPLQQELDISFFPTQYSAAAEAARFILTDTFGWSVSDGGLLTLPDLQDQAVKVQTNDVASIGILNSGGKPDSCVADALPDGLEVEVVDNTCAIVGTPTTAQAAIDVTIIATNALGSDSALIMLTIEQQTPFVTRWKTDNPGMSDDNQITIHTAPGMTYNYRVEWGDGSFDENVTGEITHTYASAGEYTVSITGTFPQPFFKATFDATQTDSQKLLSVEKWGNRTWRSMRQAFFDCRNLTINDPESPDLSQVTSMVSMFANADNLRGNISNWDVSRVTFMSGMFSGADNFNLDVSSWNVSNVTNMDNMFRSTKFNHDISNWDVAKVTNMNAMFQNARVFNQPIGNWNVGNVTNMFAMFREADAFNQPIDNWNVGNVTNMVDMFFGANLFNADISNWDVSNVTDMGNMFRETGVFNQPIGNWNVANVRSMREMFFRTPFNQDISQWNTSNVTDMGNMFREARAFNQPIGNWDVANVTTMKEMFLFADVFNADISSWNVSKVTDMSNMFRSTKAFDQNLGNWNIANVNNMSNLFLEGVLSTANYDALLTGWSQLPSVQPGVVLNMGTTRFSAAAQTARDTLINNAGWTITDGGLAE
jgi:surface protein